MKHEAMTAARRPWFAVGTRDLGPADGFRALDALHPGQSAGEVADALLRAAAELGVAETRCW